MLYRGKGLPAWPSALRSMVASPASSVGALPLARFVLGRQVGTAARPIPVSTQEVQVTMRVEYTFDALQDCQCGSCPVHDGSQCILQKTAGKKFTYCSSEPAPNDVEGIYCSFKKGQSACTDLATAKACLCPTCPVWRSHSLDTAYFCTHGAAS